jgi:peptidoglycan/xylan/chitin deacetylase (PgdA/CDA1 family)
MIGKLRALNAAGAGLVLATSTACVAFPGCQGPLTGRSIHLSDAPPVIGSIYGAPSLPLKRGEYVLSFDDGPFPATTPHLLEILDRHCVKGTFMMVGRRAHGWPDQARAIVAAGNSVGNHSYSHQSFRTLDLPSVEKEVDDGAAAVSAATGGGGSQGAFHLFRFPGEGLPRPIPDGWIAYLKAHHYTVFGYDITPEDWRNSPPAESFARFQQRAGDRGIILMHDSIPNTPALLDIILTELERRKAKVVSLVP